MKLEVGDVMLTGTPKGVGQIVQGDVVTCGLRVGSEEKDILGMKFDVKDRQNSSYHFKP
jgi:acylpyruvate hydrolase